MIATVTLVTLLATGCALLRGEPESVTIQGERLLVNGVPNDPVGPKVEAGTFDTPSGAFTLLTYDSEVGPCYDVRFPDGTVQPGCLRVAGVDPARPVTGRPDTGSVHAISGSAFNHGLARGGTVGMVHHGVAHPDVAEVRVEPASGSPLVFRPVAAPNVGGLRVFFAYAPRAWAAYRLVAYDAAGCALESTPVRVRAAQSEQPEEGVPPGRDC